MLDRLTGLTLAAAAWAAHLAVYPWVLAYAVTTIPASRAFTAFLDDATDQADALALNAHSDRRAS